MAYNGTDTRGCICSSDGGVDDVAVADRAKRLIAYDATDIFFAGNVGPIEGEIAYNGKWIIARQATKEASIISIIIAGIVDSQVADGVISAIEGAVEGTRTIDTNRREVFYAAHVNVTAKLEEGIDECIAVVSLGGEQLQACRRGDDIGFLLTAAVVVWAGLPVGDVIILIGTAADGDITGGHRKRVAAEGAAGGAEDRGEAEDHGEAFGHCASVAQRQRLAVAAVEGGGTAVVIAEHHITCGCQSAAVVCGYVTANRNVLTENEGSGTAGKNSSDLGRV